MKAIISILVVAIFSTALAGCWFYSRPDATAAGCQKTTYGIVTATTSTENCSPAPQTVAPATNIPEAPPPLPPPATP
jgi:hypothetical protein